MKKIMLAAAAALFMLFAVLPVCAEDFGYFTGEESLLNASYSTSAVKITSVRGSGVERLTLKASVTEDVSSYDNKYYVFAVDPTTNELLKKVAAKEKSTSLNVKLKTESHPEYVQYRYCIAVRTKKGSDVSCFARVSNIMKVTYPERAAKDTGSYKLGKNKKGLQSHNYAEVASYGCGTMFMNLYVDQLLEGSVPFEYDGKTYYFQQIYAIETAVSAANADNCQVTMQIMLRNVSSTSSLIAPGGTSSGFLFGYNLDNLTSRKTIEAAFAYLASRLCREDCYVSNWILGNEVNQYGYYYNTGSSDPNVIYDNYAQTFELLYNAVRSRKSGTKLFICLDHSWNLTIANQRNSKYVLDLFASKIRNLRSDIQWNVAMHPYPNLNSDCRFWKSDSNVLQSASTYILTMNNIKVLTDYVKSTYGSDIRIILSETGYAHTSVGGQDAQAAAIALSYFIAACNPRIDAFIYNAEAGMNFNINGKKANKVFKKMSASGWKTACESILESQVGSNWKSYVNGFGTARLKKMYSDCPVS